MRLKSLELVGKECYIEAGPHGAVFTCILKIDGEDFEIPKVSSYTPISLGKFL